MAEDLLVNGTTEILKKLSSIAAHEIGLMWGVKAELKKLQRILNMIRDVLEDAEIRQVNEKAVRRWLQMLKQAAYDAEDILDEVAYENLRRKMEIQNRFKNKVRNFFSLSNPLAFRLKVAHKIQDVNRILNDIGKEKEDFKLKEERGSASNDQSGLDRDTSPFVDDSEVFGREDDKSKIIRLLLDDSNIEEIFSVIPIVGFGGLGKTTLAQLVYNDEVVIKHFNLKEWVCVSDDSDDKILLREVFQGIVGSKSELPNKNGMQSSIKEKLIGKKFLIILDDVWNPNSDQWDDLKLPLGCGAKGSRVIITTRKERVADVMGTVTAHHLEQLSEDNCRAIFERRAFRMGGPQKTPILEAIGRAIVEKCGGVPLAVKALGGLMHSKKTTDEWLSIMNSTENLKNIVQNDNIMGVLKLSYDHLPSPLKQCFAYCAIFPKDIKIKKDNLIRHWMAQGYIMASRDCEMEEVGNDYFKTLCWNSFFQNIEVNKYGDAKSCKMHDLMHNLAESIMGKECLTTFFGTDVGINNRDIKETRHLRMDVDYEKQSYSIPKKLYEEARKLRTFFSCINDKAYDTFLIFRGLRVLSLRVEKIEEVPSSIGKLKHLRYLSLQSFRIQELPTSICQLYNLETLDLEDCKQLIGLPRKTWKLMNLRHLVIGKETGRPIEFGRLHHLRTIPPLFLEREQEGGCGIGELEHLNHLSGCLRIYNMEKVKSVVHVKKANLREKRNVHVLKLSWGPVGSYNYGEVLEALGAPPNLKRLDEVLEALGAPPNLKRLQLKGFPGANLPTWLWLPTSGSSSNPNITMVLINLVKIKLIICDRLEKIPPLWHLPSLEILEIEGTKRVKTLGGAWPPIMNHRSISPPSSLVKNSRLKRLSLMWMDELEEWVVEDNNCFPYLEELIVEHCDKLRIITPTQFPALKTLFLAWRSGEAASSILNKPNTSLPSLKKLQIYECRDLVSIGNINVTRLPCLEELTILWCDKLTLTLMVSSSSSSLKEIKISKIYGLIVVEESNNNNHKLMTSLTDLYVDSVPEFTTLPKGFLQSCKHLRSVRIFDCPKFKGFLATDDDVTQCSSSLQQIQVSNCSDITCVDLRGLTSLQSLQIKDCQRLEFLQGLQSLGVLREFELSECPSLGLGRDVTKDCFWPCLEKLWVKSCKNATFTATLFPSLKTLRIVDVPEFEAFPKGFLRSCKNSLEDLELRKCPKFQGFDDLNDAEGQQRAVLTSLKKLYIVDCKGIKAFLANDFSPLPSLQALSIGGFSEELKSLPHQLQHLTTLKELEIQDLDGLIALPEWLGNLSSLQKLYIHGCKDLMHLPSKQAIQCLTSLQGVSVGRCPILAERLRPGGDERLKIPDDIDVYINTSPSP